MRLPPEVFGDTALYFTGDYWRVVCGTGRSGLFVALPCTRTCTCTAGY